MNAPSKKPVAAETVEDVLTKMDQEREANLRLWNAVSKTDPAHTKRVNQRGGFTAISAHYQVMSATRAFGPIGIGWGYVNGDPIFDGGAVFIPVTIWHGDRGNTFGPVFGGADLFDGRGKVDSDAPKKAATDGLTKGLSQLGFNADVFLGRFDDNKYVEQMREEFSPKTDETPAAPREKLEGPYPSPTALKGAIKAFATELAKKTDLAEFNAWMATPDVVELEKQAKRYLPDWWEDGITDKPEFEPMTVRISRKARELDELETIRTREEA